MTVGCSPGARLWRARPGATSTFEESVTARALFVELHKDQFWNPWRMEEEAAALGRAQEVMEEWERAEPDFQPKTKRQLDAQMKQWDRDFERRQAERETLRQTNLTRYDPEREKAPRAAGVPLDPRTRAPGDRAAQRRRRLPPGWTGSDERRR